MTREELAEIWEDMATILEAANYPDTNWYRLTAAMLREDGEALAEIAKQRLSHEVPDEEGGDFVDGYDCCVKRARDCLKETGNE